MRPEQPYNAAGPASVVVGHVAAPWGILGELRIDPLTDNPERFLPGSVLCLRGRPTKIARSRKSGRLFIVKLDGVDDRNAAEALRGEPLTISPEEAPPLSREGTYYHFQIIGMEVFDESGDSLGEVAEILRTGGKNDVLHGAGTATGVRSLLPAHRRRGAGRRHPRGQNDGPRSRGPVLNVLRSTLPSSYGPTSSWHRNDGDARFCHNCGRSVR